tara:strand:- start:394 stop:1290 length:897 start_codon:yes stop_codon:yes gene_type:complete
VVYLPKGIEINSLIDDLRLYSWSASDILLKYGQYLKDEKSKNDFIKNKENKEPVTLADLEVNNLIIKNIQNKYANINWGILSEETFNIDSKKGKKNNWLWVLDPLDGTKDFIQRTGNFAMHLALNYKNKPYLGVVLIPEMDELWIANGTKVWCENKNGIIKNHNLSNAKNLEDMTLVTSRNHSNSKLKNLIKKLGFKTPLLMGSIGCKIASILRGEADIYISLSLPGKSAPKDWDFAAPEAILKQAGGAITTIDNKELIYGKEGYRQEGLIIASHDKKNHERICLDIKNVLRSNKINL